MGAQSKIEWTDATWTPIRARDVQSGRVGHHCEHVTEACRNCYAERMNRRLGTHRDFTRQNRDRVEIFLDEKMLVAPLRWQKPRTIFVGSMTDVAGEFVTGGMLDRIFAIMALCPRHTFILLTKRPARLRDYLCRARLEIFQAIDDLFPSRTDASRAAKDRIVRLTHLGIMEPLQNVIIGTSIHDQSSADQFVPLLRATAAAKRMLSVEPMLGQVDLTEHLPGIDWVICGGESGPRARPMHPDWVRSLRDQCVAAAVPFFFKQWGEWMPVDGRYTGVVSRVGKKTAGRLLDGREWNEVPK